MGSLSLGDIDARANLFAVYDTAGINDDEILQSLLAYDTNDESFKIHSGQSFHQKPVQQLIPYHRQHYPGDDEVWSTMFLVFDRPSYSTDGVLLVNLAPYHCFTDALRFTVQGASDAIMSLSIEHTNWFDLREAQLEYNARNNFAPSDWFAVYDVLSPRRNGVFSNVFEALIDGVGEIGVEGPPKQLPQGVSRNFYRAVSADGDVHEVVAQHVEYATTHGLDPARFAVVDNLVEDTGTLFVSLNAGEEWFRCKGPVAGEVLNWVYIGLMSWEEAAALL